MKEISRRWSFFALRAQGVRTNITNRRINKIDEQYYDIERRIAIKEEARMFRRKFLTYEQAEVIYSISHRKLRDLAEAAGAVYRINDVNVLINKEILDDFIEQFRQPARTGVKI